MTKLLILGGSGRTGLHLLEQAARRGHTVRALVRNPDALQARPGVELVKGTPERLEDLREAMKGAEAVIVAHNNSRASDNPWAKQINSPTFMTDSARNLLAVMGEQRVRRVVFVSAIGVGDSWPTVSWVFRAFIRLSNIRIGYADHDGVDALARKSDVDWTLVRAVGLTDKVAGALGPLHTTEVGGPKPGTLSVTRAEVATFCLDCVETNAWVHRAPILWNGKNQVRFVKDIPMEGETEPQEASNPNTASERKPAASHGTEGAPRLVLLAGDAAADGVCNLEGECS